MIAPATITQEINVDFDKLFDAAAEEFKKHNLEEADMEAFNFAVKFLKKQDWANRLDFPDDLSYILELSTLSKYRSLCLSCDFFKASEEDVDDCAYFKRCGAGEVLDLFVDYLEECSNKLLIAAKVEK